MSITDLTTTTERLATAREDQAPAGLIAAMAASHSAM